MLTKDLLIFRRYRGNIHPGLIKTEDAKLLQMAADLIAIAQYSIEEKKTDFDEALNACANAFYKPKIAKGLAKLICDRCEFAEVDESIAMRRQDLLQQAATIFRELDPASSLQDYRNKLRQSMGADPEVLQEHLYGDLPGNRVLLRFRPISPQKLLQRYNLAQVQGLMMYAQKIVIEVHEPKLLELRKLLRKAKFCRLIVDVQRSEQTWTLSIDGPATIFDMQKTYGLQLAQFFGEVPVLSRFKVEAEIRMPQRPSLQFEISEKHGLTALDPRGLGYIPPEIEQFQTNFADENWSIDLMPDLRHIGTHGICVPDFSLRRQPKGPQLAFELFHRWHRYAFLQRLESVAIRPDPYLFFGLDQALIKDAELHKQVAEHPQVFFFNKFPTKRAIQPILQRFEQAAQAE